ncbi:pilin [Micromonospora sp. NPDC051141]|uniref:pilin n=1 Tax=Micromonospora sp. NPDC051141 TaxID=3364284 RepID=UPI0037A96463
MFRVPARARAFTHSRTARRVGRIAALTGPVLLFLSMPAVAYAGTDVPAPAVNSLPVVIANLRYWLVGILAALATLFLVLAGVYWATAGGDPAQVERAKGALRNALIGYGVAVLAPVLLEIIQGIVRG